MATHEAVNGVSRGDAPESRLEALDLPLYDRTAYVEGGFGAKTPFGQVDVDGNLSISSDVQDFFLLRPQAWGELRITLSDLESNAFLVLMDANGNLIESSNNAGAAEESITVEVSSSQDYYLQVGLWDTSDTRYSLKVHTPSPWEDRINGAPVGDTKFPGGADVAGVLLSASDSNVLGSTGRFEDQEDVYVVTPQYSGEMSAQLRALKDDLRLVVYDADFNSLDHSVTAGTAEENVSTTVVAGETYYFLIDGAYSSYILDVNTPNDPPMPPDVVPELSPGATIFNGDVGDSLNLATSIELSEHPAEPIRITGSIGYQYGDNQSDSADFYRFTPDHSGFMTVGVLTSQDGMQVILRDEQGNALEQFNASDNGYESLLYRQEVVKDQVYYIEVDGISNSTAAVYDMFIKLNFPSDKVNGNGYGEAGETFADAIDIGVEANSSTITLEGSVGFYDVNRNFDSLDYYTVKPTQSGMATITVADLEHPLTLSVLNTYGETLYSAIHNAGSSEDVELNFGQNLQYFIKAASDTGTSYRLDVSVPMGDQSGGPVSTNPPTPAALDWLLAQLNGQWQSLSAIQFDLNLFELLTQLTQGILPVGVGDDVYMPNPLDIGFSEFDDEAEQHYAQPSQVIGAVRIGLSSADLARDQHRAIVLALLVTGFGMLLAALMGYILSRYISRPVLRLRQQVLGIQKGDLTARFDTFSEGEFGELEKGVEQMAMSLRHSMKGMQEAIDSATGDLRLMVAELKNKNTQLNQARAEAEQLSKDKSRFLATMSHELRTPLNAILGFSRQLSDRDPDQREHLQIIHHSCQQLELLMDDVLTFSKLDGGSLELHLEPLSIRVLARDLLNMLSAQVDNQPVSLQLQVDSEVPEYAKTDRLRLSQILSNLLTNALKNTAAGEVLLKISCCPQPSALRFDVIDTGTGIAEHDLNSLFEPFRQLQQQPSSGVGLGLAIVKSLTEIMGGDIEVESTLGQGSCFTLILPVEMSNEEKIEAGESSLSSHGVTEAMPQAPWRVLVVEDNGFNQKLFRQLLQARNAQVDIVADAIEMIDSSSLNRYQLILMDQHMPSMNGIDACECIRQRVDPAELPPIILVTADVLSDYEISLRQGLVDAVLYKPIDEDKLDQLLRRFIPAGFYQRSIQNISAAPSAMDSNLSLELQRLMTEMKQSLDNGQYDAVAGWLHQLQGVAGYHRLLEFQIQVESLSELLALKEYEEVRRCLVELEDSEIIKDENSGVLV